AAEAAWSLAGPSWRTRASAVRWPASLPAGLAAAATIGTWLVLVLLGCGAIELLARHGPRLPGTWTTGGDGSRPHGFLAAPALVLAAGGGGLASGAGLGVQV